MERNNDFWDFKDSEKEEEENLESLQTVKEEDYEVDDRFERTRENEFDSSDKKPDFKKQLKPRRHKRLKETLEDIAEKVLTTERGFEVSFSWAYNNCKDNRRDSKKTFYEATQTVEQGIGAIKIRIIRNYPNAEINSIIYKE